MALIGLMNSLKEEGRRYNITVNAIAPIALTRMSEPATTPQYAPLMKPEFVTAAVAWLCAPDNTDSGHIIQAGVGYYAKIEVREAAGVLFDPEAIPQPEQIRDRYPEITDMGEAAPYANASAVIRKVFKMVKPKG